MLKKWGFYIVLLKGRQFKIKVLYFKKGGQISMQRHKHRSETWFFIFGSGLFTKMFNSGVRTCTPVSKGDCVFVDDYEWHHYKAIRRTLVIEAQVGAWCEESDIERICA